MTSPNSIPEESMLDNSSYSSINHTISTPDNIFKNISRLTHETESCRALESVQFSYTMTVYIYIGMARDSEIKASRRKDRIVYLLYFTAVAKEHQSVVARRRSGGNATRYHINSCVRNRSGIQTHRGDPWLTQEDL